MKLISQDVSVHVWATNSSAVNGEKREQKGGILS